MKDLKSIIKNEYEKKYKTQDYEDSALKYNFEDVVLRAMTRVKLLNTLTVVGHKEQLIAFSDFIQSDTSHLNYDFKDLVQEYLDSL